MRSASGVFSVMPAAMCLRTVVLPALAGDRISPRCPLPMGLIRLIRRWVRFFWSVSMSNISSGKTGTSESKYGRRLATSGSTPLTVSTRSMPQYFSWSFGGARLAGDAVAGAQAEAADLGGADVDVLRRRHDAVDAQEAEALVDDLEDALGHARLAVAVARLRRRQRDDVEQLEDEVGVLELLVALDVVLGGELAQLLDRLGLEVGQVQARPRPHRSGTDRCRSTSTGPTRSRCGGAA